MTPLKADPHEIARALAVFVRPNSVVELRVPKTEHEGTVSGYFDDFAELAKQLAARNGATAVYFTMNSVKPALLARAKNRVKTRVKLTTSDTDILIRIWLLIDCDPVRPADISSSDEEHRAALERAREIRFVLSEEGWPAPILVDSGNGAHLYYSVNLPNDDASTELIKRTLKALAARFDDGAVKIDQTVFNASRIIKAPGTVARKGDDVPERRHRLSRLIDVPSRIEQVSRDLLEELASSATPPPRSPPRQSHRAFQVEEWIRRHHLAVHKTEPHDGGRKFVLKECPFNPDHKAPDAAIFEGADGRPGFKCFHNSCSAYGWHELRERIEGPRARPTGAQSPCKEPESWEDPIPLRDRTVPVLRADRMPGALGAMAGAVARATETPADLAGLAGLGVISSSVAGKVNVEVEPGYVEPLNLYIADIMESGNRKTAVVNHMTRPLVDWEQSEAKRLEPEIKRAASARKTIEARIDYLRKRAAKASANTTLIAQIAEEEASLPDVLQPPRLWCQDMTPEKLADLMQSHGERMAVFSDEGGIFDTLAGRYNNGVPNLDLVLQAHSGSAVRVDRVSKPPVFLRKPVLTIAISPQPDVLERLSDTPQFRGRGLLARFLYALPASPLGARTLSPTPVLAAVAEDYRRLIERLLNLSPPVDHYGSCQPWGLKLSQAAYERWKEFQRHVETLMREGAKLQFLRDWASKLPGATARIAGIYHCAVADLPKVLIIEKETMDHAIDLATVLIEHTLAAFDLMGRDPTVVDAQKLLAWVRRENHQAFTVRGCFRAHQSRFRRVAAMRPALDLLVERGYLRRVPVQVVEHRPTEIYEVNPKALETD